MIKALEIVFKQPNDVMCNLEKKNPFSLARSITHLLTAVLKTNNKLPKNIMQSLSLKFDH